MTGAFTEYEMSSRSLPSTRPAIGSFADRIDPLLAAIQPLLSEVAARAEGLAEGIHDYQSWGESEMAEECQASLDALDLPPFKTFVSEAVYFEMSLPEHVYDTGPPRPYSSDHELSRGWQCYADRSEAVIWWAAGRGLLDEADVTATLALLNATRNWAQEQIRNCFDSAPNKSLPFDPDPLDHLAWAVREGVLGDDDVALIKFVSKGPLRWTRD